MTDKEFKRLSRAELIDVIYQLQLQLDTLTEEKASLEKEIEDKRLRIKNAGSIAEAALEINDLFKNAQNAAEQYLSEIKILREETETEKNEIIKAARIEAAAIIGAAKKISGDYDEEAAELLKKIYADSFE